MLLLLLLEELLLLDLLCEEATLLVELLDRLVQALVGKLLVDGLRGWLAGELPLEPLHVGVVAEQDHLEEVRLLKLDLFDVEAHLGELLFEE